MRTVLFLVVLSISSLSGCSLYFDEDGEHKGNLQGPDAGFDTDAGCGPCGCPDGGILPDADVDDGGVPPDSYALDGGGYPDPTDGGGYPCNDGGVDGGVDYPDANTADGGGYFPDAYPLDGGSAPDAP